MAPDARVLTGPNPSGAPVAGSSRYRGRFAPSPSGPLHFGSIVAALASYLDARAHDGVWLVRIEDIDTPRSVPGAARAIIDALSTFGLVADEPICHQSARLGLYAEALERLRSAGAVFACGCTRAQSRGVYTGRCRNGLAPGMRPRSVRVRVDGAPITFTDRARGPQSVSLATTSGDFIVRRADGMYAYHLAVTVDDAAQGISHIVRGADLLEATAPQIHLQRLLGLPTPEYLHVPVVVDGRGRKLSKQNRAPPVALDAPVPTLLKALRVLRQEPPRSLETASTDAVLDWAIGHWCPERLRGVDTGVV